jgi:hypothetical protein
MSKTFVGIDNGVTGSIGVIHPDGKSSFLETPVIKVPSYTKKKQFMHRIDWAGLNQNLPDDSVVVIERPMVNPGAFMATASALRALEATLIVMEMRGLEYVYIDSKEWQSEFISSSIIGHKEMKDASKRIGIQLFPNHTSKINKHGDADGILIAEYARRKYSR